MSPAAGATLILPAADVLFDYLKSIVAGILPKLQSLFRLFLCSDNYTLGLRCAEGAQTSNRIVHLEFNRMRRMLKPVNLL